MNARYDKTMRGEGGEVGSGSRPHPGLISSSTLTTASGSIGESDPSRLIITGRMAEVAKRAAQAYGWRGVARPADISGVWVQLRTPISTIDRCRLAAVIEATTGELVIWVRESAALTAEMALASARERYMLSDHAALALALYLGGADAFAVGCELGLASQTASIVVASIETAIPRAHREALASVLRVVQLATGRP